MYINNIHDITGDYSGLNMLEIQNLSKQYANGVKALNNINLSIEKGMFGLLGPNGAGKSTLMRTIATLQLPDQGKITFDGIDVIAEPILLKNTLGYLPQEFGVYPRISAYELLDYLAVMKGINDSKARKSQVLQLLDQVNLYQTRNNNVATFSGGMKRRFGIAQALLGQPKLIMVDEPTAGLDPEERNRFYNLLFDVAQNSVLILSTHLIEDIQALCSEMAVINKGKLLTTGSPKQLITKLAGKVWAKETAANDNTIPGTSRLLSTKTVGASKVIFVEAEECPDNGFELAEVNLEHAYFSALNQAELAVNTNEAVVGGA